MVATWIRRSRFPDRPSFRELGQVGATRRFKRFASGRRNALEGPTFCCHDGGAGENVAVTSRTGRLDEPGDRTYHAVNVGGAPYEEVTIFFLAQPCSGCAHQRRQPPSWGMEVGQIISCWAGMKPTRTSGSISSFGHEPWFAVLVRSQKYLVVDVISPSCNPYSEYRQLSPYDVSCSTLPQIPTQRAHAKPLFVLRQ